MIIPYINKKEIAAAEISDLLDRNEIAPQYISTANWPAEFPYTPDVRFRIAHNGSMILLEYTVAEDYIRAMAKEDNGPVWEDSCVEMFITFDNLNYYNIECNCCGKVLLACGPDRNNRTYSTPECVGAISRATSITDTQFDSCKAPDKWCVRLAIPVVIFFADNIKNLHGMKARANFYKCGDKLPVPHFLSWKPINVPAPDFHLPHFFGEVVFE